MIHWYAVHTHPKAEAKAFAHLHRQGFEAYLPQMARRRIRADGRTTSAPVPLFPRYLFTALDLEKHRWRAVHSTIGVRHLVTCGGGPASEPLAMPDGVITALRARENADGVIDFKDQLKTGDKVTVTNGPFEDFTGHLADMPDDRRVIVLLNILGRETRAVLPRAQVRPAA